MMPQEWHDIFDLFIVEYRRIIKECDEYAKRLTEEDRKWVEEFLNEVDKDARSER